MNSKVEDFLKGVGYLLAIGFILWLCYIGFKTQINACKKQVELGVYKNVYWCLSDKQGRK